jgi:hypothetical protein
LWTEGIKKKVCLRDRRSDHDLFAFGTEGAINILLKESITCLPSGQKERSPVCLMDVKNPSPGRKEQSPFLRTEGIDPLFALWTEGAITICLPSGEKEQRKEMQAREAMNYLAID